MNLFPNMPFRSRLAAFVLALMFLIGQFAAAWLNLWGFAWPWS